MATLELTESYTIARDAMDALRALANGAAPGFEVGGQLRPEGYRLVRFEAIRNVSNERGWYEPERWPLLPWTLVHSHPACRHAGPSEGDVAWMRHWARPLAVFEPETDSLIVWKLDPSKESGVRAVSVAVEARPRSRPRPPRRPGRRG